MFKRFTRAQILSLFPLFLTPLFSTAAPSPKPDVATLYRTACYIDTASGFEIRTATESGKRITDYDLFATGNALSIMGDYTHALDIYEKLSNRFPDSHWSRHARRRSADLYAAKGQWLDCADAWVRYLSSLLPEISHDLQDPRIQSSLSAVINALNSAGISIGSASLPSYILKHYPSTSLAYVYQLQAAQDSWQKGLTDSSVDHIMQCLAHSHLPPTVLRARLGIAEEVDSATITRERWVTLLSQIPDSTSFQRLLLTRTDRGPFNPYPVYVCNRQDIAVDGARDDWTGIAVLDLDRDLYVFRGRRDSFEDFSTYFQSTWNEEFLFVLLHVLDDKHSQRYSEGRFFEGDCLEIACHSILQQTDSLGRIVPDMELIYALHDDGRIFGPGGEYPLKNSKDGQCVIRKSKINCLYEIAIPWNKITRSPIEPGFRMWFNITMNDSDGDSRKCTIKWTPRTPDNVPAAYGTLELR